MSRKKYYSLDKILSKGARYNVIIGERSNGKTYAVNRYGLKNYIEHGKQMAVVRRWQDDFTGKRGQTMFDSLVNNGEVTKLSGGKWSGIHYHGGRWYLCRYTDKCERETDETPFAYGFAISTMEHDKSTSYPNITTVLFDEFLTRTSYLNDEFVLFMNVLSTIIRDRKDVTIFMCGNTVNKYSPYFREMGLKHVKEMKAGEIDVYTYGNSDLTVAVEYTLPNVTGKDSDVYFAFDNPKLSMIKGGEWEIDIYPHCPAKYKPADVAFTYFIVFDGNVLQCEVVTLPSMYFTFIHPKTTPLKDEDHDVIYTTEFDPRPNYKRNLLKPTTVLEKKILSHYAKDKIFYSDNEVGEVVRNFLIWCGKKA